MGYIFDPNILQDIVKKNLNLPLEERLDAIIADIDKAYPKRICTKKKWAFTIAGGVAGQLTLLYGSISEYLLIEVSTKNLARQAGRKRIEPCRPEVAQRHSGYQVGGCSPFGTRKKMPIYLERSILELPRIYINGGRRGFLVCIAPGEIVRSLAPRVVEVGRAE